MQSEQLVAFTFKGTHKQDFMGIPATGKSVEVQGMVIREIIDNLTFFQQLGVVAEMS